MCIDRVCASTERSEERRSWRFATRGFPVRIMSRGHERRASRYDSIVERQSVRIPIRFDGYFAAMARGLLLPQEKSFIDIDGERVHVRMAWAFRTTFDRSAVTSAEHVVDMHPISRGVHGWRGRWLVNGSGDNVVRIELMPAPRAWVTGIPVRLRELLVTVDDPAVLVRALRAPRD